MRLSLSEGPKLTLPAVCVPEEGDGTRREATVPNFARIPFTSQVFAHYCRVLVRDSEEDPCFCFDNVVHSCGDPNRPSARR